ncbi:MAG: glycosyltransferase family 4 protein [Lachnospiraceae bacterium]|nr:glycosyltransferase family 4 protein [Lachnospiraceae bacterium]
MRIAINANMLVNGNFTGIPRYTYEIIKCWADTHDENEYFLLANRKLPIEKKQFPDNWHFIDEPVYRTYKWYLKLNWFLLINRIDVYYTSDSILPFVIPGIRYYSTIHDLAFLKYDVAENKNARQLRRFLKPSAMISKRVFVVSKATALDVMKYIHIPKRKIVLGYNGCSRLYEKFLNLADRTFENKDLDGLGKFFLFISTIEPRKNIITIVKAYEEFCDKHGKNYYLVLAGGLGWKYDETLNTIESCRYRDHIIMPGFVSEKDKLLLLNAATLFLFPSLYEGFGIPIIEAFEFGLPVITTNISSMPEVAGDAAFYIDEPCDHQALAHQMELVINLGEDELKIYKKRMKKQLRRFSWKRTAEKIINIIEMK